MARHNIVNHSNDDVEEVVTLSPPPPAKKKASKVAQSNAEETEIEDKEEALTSMDEFIDDQVLDNLSKHSVSAEEGFTNHEADHCKRTPPFKCPEAPKFPADANDKGVEESGDFQADIVTVASVQKKIVKQCAPHVEIVTVDNVDSDKVTIISHKKAPAKKNSTAVAPAKLRKTPSATKASPIKKTPKKKNISIEYLTDTNDDAIGALKLAKDDQMYLETKSAKVQASNLKLKKQKTGPVDAEDVEKTPMCRVNKEKYGILKDKVFTLLYI